MNKRGASLSGWTEGALGILLLVFAFGLVVASLNVDYGKNFDGTLGMTTNTTYNDLVAYQATTEQGMQGEATTNAFTGISLGTTWGMIKAGLTIGFNFVTGGWIENAVGLLRFGAIGTYLGLILRLAFVTSMAFILLKLILKVRP